MIDILNPLIKKFMPFARKRMGFNNPPKLFLRSDDKNANDPLGKTAYYDPDQKSITLYVTGRHPKDVMRSLSHELVHHTQNCRGEFDEDREMGEGYAQKDEHMREMEREAYEVGNMCFRDWEDSIKMTIYFEHLQKGEKKMSIKDWKNKEISTLLSEAWGFKFNTLEEFNEFNGAGEVQEEEVEAAAETVDENTEETVEEAEEHDDKDEKMEEGEDHEDEDPAGKVEESTEEALEENVEQIFAPNHYCVHHGGVNHNGNIEMAEAVQHVAPDENGHISHYDMKLADGTILENVAAEDIQVTNASLAEGHGDKPGMRDGDKHPPMKKKMKKKEEDEELDERREKRDRPDPRKRPVAEVEDQEALREAIKAVLSKHLKG